MESWARSNPDSTEYWALPACNFTGNLELTFGGARTNDETGTHATDIVAQGKTVFRTLQPNGVSWGLAAGGVRKPTLHTGGILDNLYAYIPASFSFNDDDVLLHTNLGWLSEKDNARRRDFLTWGVGTEMRLAQPTWFIAEAFGRNEGQPFLQVGFRHWVVLNHVQIDVTYGNRIGLPSDERWVSIGLRLISSSFLP